MFEPKPAEGVADQVVFNISGGLQHSEAFLRLYGHPDVLGVAAGILGQDFVPFQEGIIIKRPGEGRSFSWHQDGVTHWEAPGRTQHSHGLNFMAQLYGSTPANGVWFVPGTQHDRADIRGMVEQAGSERLRDAVPLVCAAGDMAISNRQVLHGSFANTSPDIRVTLNMGFLPRRSVVGRYRHPYRDAEAGHFRCRLRPSARGDDRICDRCPAPALSRGGTIRLPPASRCGRDLRLERRGAAGGARLQTAMT